MHMRYVYTVLKMFKELEVPKGNRVKNESIIKLMDQFSNQISPRTNRKRTKKKILKNP